MTDATKMFWFRERAVGTNASATKDVRIVPTEDEWKNWLPPTLRVGSRTPPAGAAAGMTLGQRGVWALIKVQEAYATLTQIRFQLLLRSDSATLATLLDRTVPLAGLTLGKTIWNSRLPAIPEMAQATTLRGILTRTGGAPTAGLITFGLYLGGERQEDIYPGDQGYAARYR